MPDEPDLPGLPPMPPDADPMALLAFMQRLMAAIQQGGDVEALMREAPPGFQELFLEAQQRMASGDLDGIDLDALMGGGLMGLGDDEPVEGEDDAPPA
ncbi:MAG TPA: hypothetical protein VFS40_09345 [Gemmatimonadales bacterium]|nr:hypothetical protein [Gemmatimonadales bacterium]